MNWKCRIGWHDWNYKVKPKGIFPKHLLEAPYTYSAVCRRCEAERFEGQFDEFDIKSVINGGVRTK